MMKNILDETDQALLAALRDDARQSTAELARRLGHSRSTIQSRIERLQRRGVIAGYSVRLGPTYTDPMVQAHVLITLDQKKTGQVMTRLRQIHGITALYAISGEHDLIAVLEAGDTAELNQQLDGIADLHGVERTNSSVILETKLIR